MLKMRRTFIVTAGLCLLSAALAAAQSRPRPGNPGQTDTRAVPREQTPSQPDAFVPDLDNGAGALAQTGTHPALGSWFGRAIQVCPQGVAPSACAFGLQAPTLYMTPTLYADGNFIGNDTFAIGGPPFGPHTTAHGSWVAVDATQFTADYVFMVNTFPPKADVFVVVRFQWQGQVIDANTAVGYVNAWFMPEIPLKWAALGPGEFPAYPSEASAVLKPPTPFYRDPNQCVASSDNSCPLVFKFTIKRVQ